MATAQRKRTTAKKKPARRSKSMRTKKGTVTSKARKKTGTGKKGKYPVFDQKSCIAACRLRHHAKGGPSASAVLAKCSRWANAHNNSACRAAIKRARLADRKRKKK